MSPWVLVAAAGVLEVFWAIALKYADGFTRLWPSLAALTGAMASFWLLSLAMRALPAGTAYAVWVGIGAAGAVIAGAMFLGEPLNFLRVAGVALILAGIVALKLA